MFGVTEFDEGDMGEDSGEAGLLIPLTGLMFSVDLLVPSSTGDSMFANLMF